MLDILVLDVLLCELSKVSRETLLFEQRVRVRRHAEEIVVYARMFDELVRDADADAETIPLWVSARLSG